MSAASPIGRFPRSLTFEHFKSLSATPAGCELLQIHRSSLQITRDVIHAKGEREAMHYRAQLAELDELLSRMDAALGEVKS